MALQGGAMHGNSCYLCKNKRLRTMRKTLLLFLSIAFVLPVFGQLDTILSHKNEISIGYGLAPLSSIHSISWPHFSCSSDKIGAINVYYTHRFSKTFGLGVTVGFDPVRLTYYDDLNGIRVPICKVKENCFLLAPHFKFNWLNSKYVNLYSKVSGGFVLITYKQTEYYPDIYEVQTPDLLFYLNSWNILPICQLAPIGIEIGTKQCAGFIQVGVGFEGILCLGFRYGLKDKE